MKLLFLFLSIWFMADAEWLTDFEQAKRIAAEKNENILLNFSGSDWCAPCMRMKKEIFNSGAFTAYAPEHLVLLNADFPRNKKNKLSREQELKNDSLAERYNPKGKFPFTLLLNASGQVIKAWDGFPNLTAAAFVEQIKKPD